MYHFRGAASLFGASVLAGDVSWYLAVGTVSSVFAELRTSKPGFADVGFLGRAAVDEPMQPQ